MLEWALVPDVLIPGPEVLAAELVAISRRGVTVEGLRDCPAIVGLAMVRARSASDSIADRAAAAQGVISQAAVRVDGMPVGVATTLLGLAPGTRGTLMKVRRRQAAELLFVSPDHFRKEREPGLIEAVADELYALDSAYRLRHRHRTEAERSPEESALRVDWLAQHRSYRRVWMPVEAMKNDLLVLLMYLREGHEDKADIADRLCNITWRYSQFLRELDRFCEEQGGLWILADVESENAAADAIYRIRWHVPLGSADDSWLRLLLAQAESEELDPFIDLLVAAGERRRELMAAWMAWAEACNLDPDLEDPKCQVHLWLAAAEEFVGLIDADWYRVADWYRRAAPGKTTLDVSRLWINSLERDAKEVSAPLSDA